MMIEATVEVAVVVVQVIHHPPAGLDHVIKRIERGLRNIIVHPKILKRRRNIIINVITRRVGGTRRNHHLVVKGITMIKSNIMMMNHTLHHHYQIMHVKY